jgi:hypothetical protein
LTESNSNKILLLQPRLELQKKKFCKKLTPGVQRNKILPASQQLELKSICCNTKPFYATTGAAAAEEEESMESKTECEKCGDRNTLGW